MNGKKLFTMVLLLLLVMVAPAYAGLYDNENPSDSYQAEPINYPINQNSDDYDGDAIKNDNDWCEYMKSTNQNGQNIDFDGLGNICDPNNYDPYAVADLSGEPFVENNLVQIPLTLHHGDAANSGSLVTGIHNGNTIDIPADPSIPGGANQDTIPIKVTYNKMTRNGVDVLGNPGVTIANLDPNDDKVTVNFAGVEVTAGDYVLTLNLEDGGQDLADGDGTRTAEFEIAFTVQEQPDNNICAEPGAISIVPNPPEVGQPVQLSTQPFDANGDPVTCKWNVEGQEIFGCSITYEFQSEGIKDVFVTVSDDNFNLCNEFTKAQINVLPDVPTNEEVDVEVEVFTDATFTVPNGEYFRSEQFFVKITLTDSQTGAPVTLAIQDIDYISENGGIIPQFPLIAQNAQGEYFFGPSDKLGDVNLQGNPFIGIPITHDYFGIGSFDILFTDGSSENTATLPGGIVTILNNLPQFENVADAYTVPNLDNNLVVALDGVDVEDTDDLLTFALDAGFTSEFFTAQIQNGNELVLSPLQCGVADLPVHLFDAQLVNTLNSVTGDFDGDQTTKVLSIEICEGGNQCPAGTLEATKTVAEQNEEVTYTADFADPNGGTVIYTWTITDANGDVIFTQTSEPKQGQDVITFSYPEDGEYTVTVTVDDGSGQCNTSAQITTTVEPNQCPVGDLTSSVEFAQEGEEVTFTADFTDPNGEDVIYTWTITNQDGNEVFTQTNGPKQGQDEITFVFPEDGSYQVTVSVDDGSNECNVQNTIVFSASPEPLTVEIIPEQPDPTDKFTFKFTPDVNGGVPPYVSYMWDLGDGTTSNEMMPTHTYAQCGEYVVTVVVTDSVGNEAEDSETVIISCDDLVTQIVPDKTTIIPGDTINFDSITSGGLEPYAYEWDFKDQGEGTTDDQISTSKVFTQCGDHDVMLVVTDSQDPADTAMDTVTITVDCNSPYLDAVLEAKPKAGYAPLEVSFSCEESIVIPFNTEFTCVWDLGDGNSQDQKTFEHTYEEPGIYEVTLTVIAENGLQDTETTLIFVRERENADGSTDPREAIQWAQLSLIDGEYYLPGDEVEGVLTFVNLGSSDLEDLKMTVMVPEINTIWHRGPFDVAPGEKHSRIVTFTIPEDAPAGEYAVRARVGNEQFIRFKHRRLVVLDPAQFE